jgi:phenylpropionate dioxygenase-like ring-hydroxylating dioxygenase large terminal subunit
MMEQILRAALAEFDVGFGPLVPDVDIINTGRVPVENYLSVERFEKETEIFRHVWLNIGLDSEVPHIGDWIVRDIEAAKASLLIVRGQNDVIRAFHNVCSHRALKLVWSERGCDKQFVCPYHAWSYGTDGSLRGIPDRQSFPNVDLATSGLVPVNIETWKGLIFVNLDRNPRQTLREFLGQVADLLEDTPLDKFRYSARLTGVVKSNWKAGLDAASEGYHVQALHRDSAKDMVCSKTNPHVHFMSIDFYGPHRRTSNTGNPDFQLSDKKPVHKFIFESVPQVTVSAGDDSLSFAGPGINPTRVEGWSNDQFSIFPNFVLNLALNGFWSMHYWPISVDSFRWEAHYHFAKAPKSWSERFAMEGSIALNRDISSEDTACTQKQQVAMASGARPFVQFGLYELLCRHEAAVLEAIVNRRNAAPMAIAAKWGGARQ